MSTVWECRRHYDNSNDREIVKERRIDNDWEYLPRCGEFKKREINQENEKQQEDQKTQGDKEKVTEQKDQKVVSRGKLMIPSGFPQKNKFIVCYGCKRQKLEMWTKRIVNVRFVRDRASLPRKIQRATILG
jgi:hypothetical protein